MMIHLLILLYVEISSITGKSAKSNSRSKTRQNAMFKPEFAFPRFPVKNSGSPLTGKRAKANSGSPLTGKPNLT